MLIVTFSYFSLIYLPLIEKGNMSYRKLQYVGNKRKRANLKTDVSRTQSTPSFPKCKHFLSPDTHTYVCISGGKKCSFFGKFGMLSFLETHVLRFALFPYYREIDI